MKHEALPGGGDIQSDERTVWVNAADGMCVGRFSLMHTHMVAVDLHKGTQEQIESASECLDCFSVPRDEAPQAWARFVAGLREHYGIDVPPSYRPAYAA